MIVTVYYCGLPFIAFFIWRYGWLPLSRMQKTAFWESDSPATLSAYLIGYILAFLVFICFQLPERDIFYWAALLFFGGMGLYAFPRISPLSLSLVLSGSFNLVRFLKLLDDLRSQQSKPIESVLVFFSILFLTVAALCGILAGRSISSFSK